MVTKEELMLDNLVMYKGEVCRVSILSSNGSIGVTDHTGATTVVSDKDLEPIEVTKELLVQNGFEGLSSSGFLLYLTPKEKASAKVEADLSLHGNDRHEVYLIGIPPETRKGFRYVHELQNALYPDVKLKLNVQPCLWKN